MTDSLCMRMVMRLFFFMLLGAEDSSVASRIIP